MSHTNFTHKLNPFPKPAPAEDENYFKAVDKLHEAARDFAQKWQRAPQETSFNEWCKACETLEQAAVEYAKEKEHSEKGQR